MTHNVTLPTRYLTSRSTWPAIFPGRYLPRLPFLGLPATICGILAIATLVAPEWIDSILPNFRQRYLPIVSFVVALALLGSIWRLVKATVGLLFFGAAALALIYSVYGGTLKNFRIPGFSIPNFSQTSHTTTSVEAPTQKYLFPDKVFNPFTTGVSRSKLPPALPDEAYFPKQRTPEDGLGLNQTGGLNKLSRYVIGMLPR